MNEIENTKNDVIQSDLSDHYLTLTTYPNYSSKKEKQKITKRWLTFDSYTQVRQLLSAENWDSMESMDLEESTNHLSDKIKEALDIVAPVETGGISAVCLLGVRTSTYKLERKRYTEKESAGEKLRRILQRENHTS